MTKLKCELWSVGDGMTPHEYGFKLEFPTVRGDTGTLYTPRGSQKNLRDIEIMLLNAGIKEEAMSQGLKTLFEEANSAGHIGHLTRSIGWQNGIFVSHGSNGESIIDGKTIRWAHMPSQNETYLGRQNGTLKQWKKSVAKPALSSTISSFAILCALAAPMGRYSGISEGVVYCITGSSSKGKTTASKIAASVSGDPEYVRPFNFTPTGCAELAAEHSDHPFFMDDTENTENDLASSLDSVTHMLTSGQDKTRSKKWSGLESANQSDDRKWFIVALMSSPAPIDTLVKKPRTIGKKVRLIEIPVPENDNGVFDNLPEGKTSSKRAKQLSEAIRSQYGTAFKAWEPQFSDVSSIRSSVDQAYDEIVRVLDTELSSEEQRLLRKIALPIAAGRSAIDAKILPWTHDDLDRIQSKIARTVLENFRGHALDTSKAWQDLADSIQSRRGFLDYRGVRRVAADKYKEASSSSKLGVIMGEAKNGVEIGFSRGLVNELSNQGCKALLAALPDKTRQPRLSFQDGGSERPRLLFVDAATMETLVRENAGDDYNEWVVTKVKRGAKSDAKTKARRKRKHDEPKPKRKSAATPRKKTKNSPSKKPLLPMR